MENILNSFSLKGKKALIICPENVYGPELAQGLYAGGAEVWTAGAEQVDLGVPVAGHFTYDHCSHESILQLEKNVREQMGVLDVVVENGMNTKTTGWGKQDFQTICDQLSKTHLGMMQTVQGLGYIMAEQGHGSMILVSDYGALVGYDPLNYKDCPEYAEQDFSLVKGFIKGGVVNYARQTSNFFAEHGCHCNAMAIAPLAGRQPKEFEEAFIRHSQVKRLATAEDVAKAVIFLASDASAYITGITLPVDGGYTAK